MSRTAHYWKYIFATVWGLIVLGAGAAFMAPHVVAHETAALKSLPTAGFSVHHFLSFHCGCSKKILLHLEERKSLGSEIIHIVDINPVFAERMKAAGFEVENLSAEESVAKYDLEVLPQLVVIKDGQPSYQGGYSRDQMHDRSFEDVRVIQEIQQGSTVAAYPVFGCANGKMRQSLVDQFGVKYGKSLSL